VTCNSTIRTECIVAFHCNSGYTNTTMLRYNVLPVFVLLDNFAVIGPGNVSNSS